MDSDSHVSHTDTCPLLSSFSSDPEMRELIEMFVHDLPSRIDAIAASVQVSDLNQLRTYAHQLKGSAGGYGYEPISDAAARLELAIKGQDIQPDLDPIRQEVDALIALCRRASLSA